MNGWPVISGWGLATTVNDKTAMQFYAELPSSPLLSESLQGSPFEIFFASTWAHREPWQEDLDFDKPESGNWWTPVHSDERARRAPRWRVETELTEQNPAPKAISDRVILLARKYVAKDRFSDEESARLAIVTERVRQLLPAVSAREFEAVEKLLKLVKQVDESDTEIRCTLGIAQKKNG